MGCLVPAHCLPPSLEIFLVLNFGDLRICFHKDVIILPTATKYSGNYEQEIWQSRQGLSFLVPFPSFLAQKDGGFIPVLTGI
jgi:hypothetical protein